MIRQYLPQTNESATVAKSKIFSHLNKAQSFGLRQTVCPSFRNTEPGNSSAEEFMVDNIAREYLHLLNISFQHLGNTYMLLIMLPSRQRIITGRKKKRLF
jgi:hypothetical protein